MGDGLVQLGQQTDWEPQNDASLLLRHCHYTAICFINMVIGSSRKFTSSNQIQKISKKENQASFCHDITKNVIGQAVVAWMGY